jgi:hypothetical protein
MKRIYTGIILSLALAAGWSCGKTDEDLYKLNVKPEVTVVSGADIAFKAIGGNGYIEVEGLEGALEATTQSSSWCHLTVEGNKIKVEVDEYTGLESRYAVVDMKSGEAEGKTIVHQFGIIVKSFSPHDIAFKNAAGQIELPYDANESVVQATTDADWVVLDNSDPTRLTIKVADNPSKEYREAEVHWFIGEMKGSFFVSQFDLADAGLLGEWDWHGKQTGNNRDFPMSAVLIEEEDGTYTLDIDYATSAVTIDISIPGVTLAKNNLQIPLGAYVGTYDTKNASYKAFTMVEEGNARTTYAHAITEGVFRLSLAMQENGSWRATAIEEDYPEKNFRFEMWTSESHTGTSSSGLILKEIYMEKL